MIHRVTFRAFAAATEDEERVKEALSIFVPLDSIIVISVEGHFGNPMKILEAILRKRDGLGFFQILREQLPKEDLQRLRREVPSGFRGPSSICAWISRRLTRVSSNSRIPRTL